MGALGTSKHHLPSVLDEYRVTSDDLSKISAELKQLLSFFLPVYNTIQNAVNKRSVFVPLNHQLYISGALVLHIRYIFSQWMLVLPRDGNRCCSGGGVVLPVCDPSYSGSYLNLPHSKPSVHAPERAQTTQEGASQPITVLIQSLTGNFEFSIIRSFIQLLFLRSLLYKRF